MAKQSKGHPKGEVGHSKSGKHVIPRKGESPSQAISRVNKRG